MQIAEEQREVKNKGEREKYIQLNAKFPKIARRDKKVFFNEQCLIIEENNKRGNIRELVKKTGSIKGEFHTKIGTIKDKNGRDPGDTEDIKKRWKEYMENCTKIFLMNQINTMVCFVTQSQTYWSGK